MCQGHMDFKLINILIFSLSFVLKLTKVINPMLSILMLLVFFYYIYSHALILIYLHTSLWEYYYNHSESLMHRCLYATCFDFVNLKSGDHGSAEGCTMFDIFVLMIFQKEINKKKKKMKFQQEQHARFYSAMLA